MQKKALVTGAFFSTHEVCGNGDHGFPPPSVVPLELIDSWQWIHLWFFRRSQVHLPCHLRTIYKYLLGPDDENFTDSWRPINYC